MQVRIAQGVFSRSYDFSEPFSAIYHTPSMQCSILEGDSAEVWRRIWEDNGNLARALEYI